jgi:hypothetical protein
MSQYIFVMNFDGMCELCCVLADSSGDVGAEHWGCDNHWPAYDFFFPCNHDKDETSCFLPLHHATHFITSSYVICHTCITTISSIWHGFQAFEDGYLFIICYNTLHNSGSQLLDVEAGAFV